MHKMKICLLGLSNSTKKDTYTIQHSKGRSIQEKKRERKRERKTKKEREKAKKKKQIK